MSTTLEQMVSVVASASDTNTTNVKVSDILADIKSVKWKEAIERIRTANASGKKASIAARKEVEGLKRALPGIMWSGLFNTRKKTAPLKDKLERHSGILCADLDDLGHSSSEIRTKLMASPHILAIFRSPSGNGLKVLVRVKPDVTVHRESFEAVQIHIRKLTGCEIDDACKDVTRLCFVSHDPDLWINDVEAKEIKPWTHTTQTGCVSSVLYVESMSFAPSMSYVSTVDEAVLKSLPRGQHNSHKSLFKLAGALWAYEINSGTELTDHQLRDAAKMWYVLAKPQLRPEQAEDECWLEFLDARENIDHPLMESVVEKAWKIAKSSSQPPEAKAHDITSQSVCALIVLCRELQIISGDNAFFLSPYTVRELFGHKSASTAAKWLSGLCRLKILKRVKKGDLAKRIASCYRFNFHKDQ